MPAKPWKDWTDDELADAAQQGMTGQGAQVEAMRRLKESIVTFSGSSDRYSRRMLWLTIVLLGREPINLQGIRLVRVRYGPLVEAHQMERVLVDIDAYRSDCEWRGLM